MLRASRGGDQDALVAVAVKLITNGLEPRPLADGGKRRRQADPAKAVIIIEERDTVEIHSPAPQIPRQGMGGRQACSGQDSIPLGPGGGRLVGEVPGRYDVAVLPAAVRWVGRLVERVAVVRDVAHEDAVYGVLVDVEGGHLRDRHFLKRSDQLGDAAVVPVADRVDRTPVIEAGDGLDQPDRDVAGVHHLGQPLDESGKL